MRKPLERGHYEHRSTATRRSGVFGTQIDRSILYRFPCSDVLGEVLTMPNQFDPYREALVVECATVWTEELDDVEDAQRATIEGELHAAPDQAAELTYVRMHTGFLREITVTASDLARLNQPQ